MPSILVCCPLHDRTLVPTLRAITELDPGGYTRKDMLYPWHRPDETDGRDRIAAQYNRARQVALDGGYDALLTVEADMLPPANAIRRLARAGADIAYGLYCFRRDPWEWNAYSGMTGMTGYPLSRYPEAALRAWGEVVEVDGLGLGCTLIQRNVLEACRFRADGLLHGDGTRSHCDWYAALDWREAGFTQVCDTSVVCGHVHPENEAGQPVPSVLWPTGEPPFYRFEVYGL